MLARGSRRPARPYSGASAGVAGADSAGRTEFPQGGGWTPSDQLIFASTAR